MSTLSPEDANWSAQAERVRRSGMVQVRMREGEPRPYVHYQWGDAEHWNPNSMLGAWHGPFKDDDEAQAFIDAGSFIASFRAGHGVWKVGYRVRYAGKNRPGSTTYVEDCPIGTTGVITADNGFSHRYTIMFDQGEIGTKIWSMHPDGEFKRSGLRTNGAGWERIYDEED
jgi:hypothetical protein